MKERTEAAPAALREEFRQRLMEERRALLRTLALTDEEMATMDAQEPGVRGGDVTVGAANAILSRLEGRERHELDEVSDALSRLEGENFGLCERCGHAIPVARLRAMPATRFCLGCQSREETRG
jgi:DnaK suppressor protein